MTNRTFLAILKSHYKASWQDEGFRAYVNVGGLPLCFFEAVLSDPLAVELVNTTQDNWLARFNRRVDANFTNVANVVGIEYATAHFVHL